MAERIQSWRVAPVETSIDFTEEAYNVDAVTVGLDKLTKHVIAANKFEYTHGGGVGGYIGLNEAMAKIFEGARPQYCNEVDDCDAEFEFYSDGNSSASGNLLEISCRGGSFKTKQEAEADEKGRRLSCQQCHLAMSRKILGWLEEVPVNLAAADADVQEAKTVLAETQKDRDKVFKIGSL